MQHQSNAKDGKLYGSLAVWQLLLASLTNAAEVLKSTIAKLKWDVAKTTIRLLDYVLSIIGVTMGCIILDERLGLLNMAVNAI